MKKILETLKRKWAEYLLEIIVITVGILGAYALNEWNNRKERLKDEISILGEIQLGLKSDLIDNIQNVDACEKANNSIKILLDGFEDDILYYDSLNHHFANTIIQTAFITQEGLYNSLMTKGFDLISNKELRNRIIKMYDFDFQNIKVLENGFFVKNEALNNYSLDHFDIVAWWPNKSMIPLNFEQLKGDIKYRTLLKSRMNENELMIFFSSGVNEKLETLIADINQEITRLKN
jgi:ABC-type uncharacterized transport system fused permease/ATPase subunit